MSEPTSQRFAIRAAGPTSLLVGINVAAYLAMVLVGGRSDFLAISNRTLMLFGADYAPLVREGQLQRLLASVFLHLNPLHLLLNSVALVSIGPSVERDYGRLRFVLIYLGAGIIGSLASVAWHWHKPGVSAGASGAICGVIAAGAVRAYFGGEARAAERRALLGWAFATLVFGYLIHADNAAHLGGLVAGAVAGLVFRRKKPALERATLPSAILIGSVVLVFAASIALRDRAETAPALVNRGVELARSDDHDAAIAAYRRAIALEPNDAIAHYDLGLSLEEIADYDPAIFHLSRAFALDPSPDHREALAGAHVNHGVALWQKGNREAAIAAYRAALAIDDRELRAHQNLELALTAIGDLTGAVREARLALAIEPNGAEHKMDLARALTRQAEELARAGKREEALACYREAIGLSPELWQSHFGLGVLLEQGGDPNGAVAELEKAFDSERSDLVRDALANALEARRDARADAGALGAALDDLGRATLLRLAPSDAGPKP